MINELCLSLAFGSRGAGVMLLGALLPTNTAKSPFTAATDCSSYSSDIETTQLTVGLLK